MAKKTKGHKEKMPKVTKLSQEQMDNFLAAIMNSNIGAENAEFAKMLIHGNAWMARQLELGQLSIAKLRKLFQIQGSEKASNRKPKNDPASSDNKGLNNTEKDTKGHGRNSADAYQGAVIVEDPRQAHKLIVASLRLACDENINHLPDDIINKAITILKAA